MKKIVTLFLLNFVIVSFSYSQLRVALIGGPSSSSILEENTIPDWQTKTKPFYSNRSGLHLGFLLQVPLNRAQTVFFQPEFLYQTKGNKFYKSYDTTVYRPVDTVFFSREFSTNYIEMPLNLGYRLKFGKKAGLLLAAGPYISFFYSGKEVISTRTFKRDLSLIVDTSLAKSVKFISEENTIGTGKGENKVNTLDLGFNFRGGFEIGNVLLTGFYSESLVNFYTTTYPGTFKHKVIGASIGFWLNKAKPIEPKIKDKDGDGVTDRNDKCPDIAGLAKYKGCPAPDADKDGVADEEDKCPSVAGWPKYAGCPVPDTDKDGVDDESDKCPEIAGTAKYNGCPIPDSDKDGVDDEKDKCPQVAGVSKYEGCPIPDTDKDGIDDEADKCPSIPGIKENNGCPEIKKEVVEKVNFAASNILFRLNSDLIESGSFAGLDEVADILSKNSYLGLDISGHSDNTGNPEKNKILSQKRADAVKKYLVKKGIDESRLSSTGYGQERPIADNSTKQGKAKNRRVEMKLLQN